MMLVDQRLRLCLCDYDYDCAAVAYLCTTHPGGAVCRRHMSRYCVCTRDLRAGLYCPRRRHPPPARGSHLGLSVVGSAAIVSILLTSVHYFNGVVVVVRDGITNNNNNIIYYNIYSFNTYCHAGRCLMRVPVVIIMLSVPSPSRDANSMMILTIITTTS